MLALALGESRARRLFRAKAYYPDGLHCWCNKCEREYQRSWRIANLKKARGYDAARKLRNPLRHRPGMLRRIYGISVGDYEAKLAEQGGACAICKSDKAGGVGKFMKVDHDHKTGVVRGLLCHTCNFGIGALKDDPIVLLSAVDYLNRWKP